MKSIFITLLFTLTCGLTYAQSDIDKALVKQSKEMIAAIVAEDYATYVDKTYAPLAELYGGKDIFIKSTKSNKDLMKTAGMVLKEADFAAASKIEQHPEGQLQSIISFNYIMDISGSDYEGRNFLLALSDDQGVTWTFVELETYDEASIKEFIPTYISSLGFPIIEGATYKEK